MTTRIVRPLALIGLMGAGKSAVARVLGERMGVSVADLDSMLEAREGCAIAELFERSGEQWFRAREAELLAQLLDANVSVLACGGGLVLDPAARTLLRERCEVVWLEVSPAEALRRVSAGGPPGHTRPLLAGADPAARLTALLAERTPLYAMAAHRRVATDGCTPAQVADAVLAGRADL